MTTPNRNNGLSAERWAPLVDLEPQFADALLEALRDEGVAAYASPAPGVRGPYMDIQLPNTPTDRVWVDAGATDTAQQVLDARRADFGPDDDGDGIPGSAPTEQIPSSPPTSEPEPAPEPDFDAAFRAIVAGYGKTGTDEVAPWSPAEDVESDTPNAGGSWRVLRRSEPDPDAGDEGWGVVEGAGPEAAAPAEPEEHFVPPPPPPLPRMDKNTKLSWAGVVGGPIFLILFTALDWYPIPYATFFAIAAFVGGFGSLVYRMKDDGPNYGDDGAVV